jgi:hypothetical protein
MHPYTTAKKLLVCIVGLLAYTSSFAQFFWNEDYSVGTANNMYAYKNGEIPANLMVIYPASLVQGASISYQWESSPTPINGFSAISGATNNTYIFSAPITQTTYYRQKATNNTDGSWFYSNTIKIQLVLSGWENKTYQRDHTVLVPNIYTIQQVDQLPIGQKLEQTKYIDGLGRETQIVAKEVATPAEGSSIWADIVTIKQYDAFGREQKQHLPYTTAANKGKYKPAAFAEQANYYQAVFNQTNPYSQVTQYDNAPINKPLTITFFMNQILLTMVLEFLIPIQAKTLVLILTTLFIRLANCLKPFM